MLKGETFDLQTFTSDAFALFNDRFMNGQCGVMQGCALSNTNNSVTIGAGYFFIKGRFLRIISSETVSGISTDGYYSLICEIDLTKINTTSVFNQGVIKVVSGVSDYPTLTQQDLTDSGTLYQYEFARFRVSSGNITNFTDRRTYVDYGTILTLIQTELANLENLSNVSLKSDFAVLTGTITTSAVTGSDTVFTTKKIDFPTNFNKNNCVVISIGLKRNDGNIGFNFGQTNITDPRSWLRNSIGVCATFDYHLGSSPSDDKITLTVETPFTEEYTFDYKIVLLKTS